MLVVGTVGGAAGEVVVGSVADPLVDRCSASSCAMAIHTAPSGGRQPSITGAAGDEDLAVDDAHAGVAEVDQADDVAAPEHQDVRRAR